MEQNNRIVFAFNFQLIYICIWTVMLLDCFRFKKYYFRLKSKGSRDKGQTKTILSASDTIPFIIRDFTERSICASDDCAILINRKWSNSCGAILFGWEDSRQLAIRLDFLVSASYCDRIVQLPNICQQRIWKLQTSCQLVSNLSTFSTANWRFRKIIHISKRSLLFSGYTNKPSQELAQEFRLWHNVKYKV